ncbi:MAG: hypothetical protein ACLUIT_14755 [Intestinibacter bartlettii]
MNAFLLNVLAGITATAICCGFRYIYNKVKNHSNADKSGLN